MLTSFSASIRVSSVSRPERSSKKTESCLINILFQLSVVSSQLSALSEQALGFQWLLCWFFYRSAVTFVNDPFRLSLRSLNAVGLHQLNDGAYSQQALDVVVDTPPDALQLTDTVRPVLLVDLHTNLHGVEVVFPTDDQLVVGCCLCHLHQHRFHLRGEDVHTADDQHVVRAAEAFLHAYQRASAITFAVMQACQIACAVAQQRHRLLGYRGEDQLTQNAVRQHLQRIRVDDLRDEVIFEDVVAALAFTLHGDPRPNHLTQPVDIVCFDIEQFLNLCPHLAGPRLGAKDTGSQFDVGRRDTLLQDALTQMCCIGGCAGQDGRFEVGHELQLFFCVACGYGDDGSTYLLSAVMQSQTPGEGSVAIGYLNGVAAVDAGHGEAACHHLCPECNISLRVTYHRRLPGGAARCMDTHHVGLGYSEKSEGVVIPQVGLCGEGQLLQLLHTPDITRLNALFPELITVERDVLLHSFNHCCQFSALQLLHLLPVGTFSSSVPDHVTLFCYLFRA